MQLYLARHGRAVPKDEHPQRPLSESGRKEIQRMASFLGRAGVRVVRVGHSGKTRAVETALLLAEVVGPGRIVEEMTGLAPNDAPEVLADAIEGWDDDIMICGHLPHLNRLASLLLTGHADHPVAALDAGAVMCLEHLDGGAWVQHWLVTPALLSP